MNCSKARPALQAILDAALPAREAAGLRAHLASCGDCRRELALLELVASSLARLPQTSPRPGFDARVLAAASAARRARALPSWAGAALNAAASATALWMAALAAFARPRPSLSSTLAFLHVARHPSVAWAKAELALAQAGLSLPEALRAARRCAAVLARIHIAPGASFSSLPFELAAAALIAGLAVAAIARPSHSYAVHRRIP